MGRKPATKLDKRDLKALSLFELGKTTKQIAAEIGVNEQWLYNLCVGDVGTCGYKATIFKEQLEAIKDKQENRIRDLTRQARELCVFNIERILGDYKSQKKLDKDDKKMVSLLTNSMAKMSPNLGAKGDTYNYTQIFTTEELAHEYGRLRAAADGPTDSRRVQEDEQAGSGEVHSPSEPGSKT